MTAPISVLIVEDHDLFRTGIRVGCQRDQDIFISGEATNGEDAIAKAASLSPDIILMDIGMPVMDGIESSRMIKERNGKTKIIMLTSQESEEAFHSAMSAGASGFCLKDIDSPLLCSAIKAVHNGQTWLDPQLTKGAMKKWSDIDKDSGCQTVSNQQPNVSQTIAKALKTDFPKKEAQHLEKLECIFRTSFGEKYECLGLLGKGGMSEVYRAKHKMLDKLVAIKFLASQLCVLESFAARFAQEARIASRLSHPNIASVNDFGFTVEGNGYLVMEYIEGPTIAEALVKAGRLDESAYLKIFRQLADALFYSHSKGIIHRDIKPANVILTTNGEGNGEVKLVDFGLAKLMTENSPSLTLNGQILGSPIYMSPEQCQGHEVDQRSDIYSLGCLMYETISGYPPFRGKNPLETFRMHVEDEIPALPSHFCSERMQSILRKCLQKRPVDRYHSVSELELEVIF